MRSPASDAADIVSDVSSRSHYGIIKRVALGLPQNLVADTGLYVQALKSFLAHNKEPIAVTAPLTLKNTALIGLYTAIGECFWGGPKI